MLKLIKVLPIEIMPPTSIQYKAMAPPEALATLQRQMSEAICWPFDFSTGTFRVQIEKFSEEIIPEIVTDHLISATKRLAVYNEQYWYRLFTVLQDDFPLLCRNLSYWEFNQLASEYLISYPPASPYLSWITIHFVEFLKTSTKWNRPQLLEMAKLDMLFINAFQSSESMFLNPTKLSPKALQELSSKSMQFQPSFCLWKENWNFMEMRIQCLADDKFKPKFDPVESYWAICQFESHIHYYHLDSIRYVLLQKLQDGEPLEQACESMKDILCEQELQLFEANLMSWFTKWTQWQWFCAE